MLAFNKSLSSMLSTVGGGWGWLKLDRVIDISVYQSVLTREAIEPG